MAFMQIKVEFLTLNFTLKMLITLFLYIYIYIYINTLATSQFTHTHGKTVRPRAQGQDNKQIETQFITKKHATST